MAKICMHAIVTGKVQGVFFRATTQRTAQELQLTGWVRNLADGTVEVTACGEQKAVNLLTQWLSKGPPHAQVNHVQSEQIAWQQWEKFDII